METSTEGLLYVAILWTMVNAVLLILSKRIERQYEKLHEESVALKEENVRLLIANAEILDKNAQTLDGITRARKPQALISYINKENEMRWVYERREKIRQIEFDDFMDWCEAKTQDYLAEAIPYFEAAELREKAEIIKAYLLQKNSI